MQNYIFSTGEEAIQALGQPLRAQRKTLVQIRDPKGTETFARKGGDLVAVEGLDYVMEPVDGTAPYPCKIDIFKDSWVETEPGSQMYRRKALSRLIPVPENVTVTLNTLEGQTTVSYPDYVVIGVGDEVYSNSKDWAEANLEFV